MGAGFFGNNTTIKVVGGGGNTYSATAVNIFTTSSSQYAILSVSPAQSGAVSGIVAVGSALHAVISNAAAVTASMPGQIYIPPSTQVDINSVTTGTIGVSWVIFANSP